MKYVQGSWWKAGISLFFPAFRCSPLLSVAPSPWQFSCKIIARCAAAQMLKWVCMQILAMFSFKEKRRGKNLSLSLSFSFLFFFFFKQAAHFLFFKAGCTAMFPAERWKIFLPRSAHRLYCYQQYHIYCLFYIFFSKRTVSLSFLMPKWQHSKGSMGDVCFQKFSCCRNFHSGYRLLRLS